MIKFVWAKLQKNKSLATVIPDSEQTSRVLGRAYGTIAWVSFLFAGLASMLFFATFNPQEIIALATYPTTMSEQAAYTLGFFLFWTLCFSTSALSYILLSLPSTQRDRVLPEHRDA